MLFAVSKKKTLITGAAVAFAGAVALLGSAGTGPTDGLSGDGSMNAAEAEFERKLYLKEDDIVINSFDEDRKLQVTVNAMQEGLYSSVGNGACVDYLNNYYDHATYTSNSLASCARLCSRSILLDEHRGFEYDSGSKKCNCLFDDGMTPQPVWKKANSYTKEETDAEGEVQSSATDETHPASLACYKTDYTSDALKWVMNPYTQQDCSVDHFGTIDIFVFSGVKTNEKCARKCNRFKLMDTYLGMTVTKDDGEEKCVCLFVEGELPTKRKLGASRGARTKTCPWSERYPVFLQNKDAECYTKSSSTLPTAAPGTQLTPDDSNRVFINEFHIRNINTNEPWMRIIGPKDSSADGYSIQSIMGRNGGIKEQLDLSGTFTSSDNAEWGSITANVLSGFTMNGKSGSDGLALVKSDGTCVQFFSYAHVTSAVRSFEASEGPCAGKASIPINVMEPRDSDIGVSIQLKGTGNKYNDFTFDGPYPKSTGTANPGQTLTSP